MKKKKVTKVKKVTKIIEQKESPLEQMILDKMWLVQKKSLNKAEYLKCLLTDSDQELNDYIDCEHDGSIKVLLFEIRDDFKELERELFKIRCEYFDMLRDINNKKKQIKD